MRLVHWAIWTAAVGISAWSTACAADADEEFEEIDSPELHASSTCTDCEPGGSGDPASSSSSSSSSSSGGTPSPDLAPVQTLGTYCARNAWGDLAVKVKNNGTVSATATTLRIAWGSGAGISYVSTPGIAAGATATVYVDMPMLCFGSTGSANCKFTLTLDAYENLSESNESNNVGSATCPGG